ncbi:hypothetical protein OS189_16870 [Sulfitobacter sp. F26169L]|uniref:nidogen-like domain-containing protein n=1 Tax=Sulfitobacter sp. F26169L TaxID=2996015 RepID=UPI002260E167|nr:nidogen-like domain-containing protein [Sulfitobacter sp. F26169L]MCX7568017.1 hypothetical protein [Sulfitobacter sp. F26169L]
MSFTTVTDNSFRPTGTDVLARNDDQFQSIDITSIFEDGITIAGVNYTSMFVNNNGNVTFDAGLYSYTPEQIGGGTLNTIIAPYWGDVDTRTDDGGFVYYTYDTVRDSIVVTWEDVGYYDQHSDRTNSFQLELIDRSGGDIEIIFRYEDIDWTTGDASNGVDGLGGFVSRAGFSLGDILFELPTSGNQSAMRGLEDFPGNLGVRGVWQFLLEDGEIQGVGTDGDDTFTGTDGEDVYLGDLGNDVINGGGGDDFLLGGAGDDILRGGDGNDQLSGGDGADTVNGDAGNDTLRGGDTDSDLRDVFYGGDGDDLIDAGFGNDQVYGGNGDDTITGGYGVDTLEGQAGNDVINGNVFSDLIFGGAGDDYINGGFGADRVNGGTGADVFFHLGIADHGSDWIQDFSAAAQDVLRVGLANATRDQFQINSAFTEGAGDADVADAFIIYRPTGQIMWALVDGMGESEINLQIAGETYDLML